MDAAKPDAAREYPEGRQCVIPGFITT